MRCGCLARPDCPLKPLLSLAWAPNAPINLALFWLANLDFGAPAHAGAFAFCPNSGRYAADALAASSSTRAPASVTPCGHVGGAESTARHAFAASRRPR